MSISAEEIRRTNPEVRATERGWLAVSEPGSVYRIAVFGETEADARDAFREELEAWAALHDLDS